MAYEEGYFFDGLANGLKTMMQANLQKQDLDITRKRLVMQEEQAKEEAKLKIKQMQKVDYEILHQQKQDDIDVYKTKNDIELAKRKLDEEIRHNKQSELIARQKFLKDGLKAGDAYSNLIVHSQVKDAGVNIQAYHKSTWEKTRQFLPVEATKGSSGMSGSSSILLPRGTKVMESQIKNQKLSTLSVGDYALVDGDIVQVARPTAKGTVTYINSYGRLVDSGISISDVSPEDMPKDNKGKAFNPIKYIDSLSADARQKKYLKGLVKRAKGTVITPAQLDAELQRIPER